MANFFRITHRYRTHIGDNGHGGCGNFRFGKRGLHFICRRLHQRTVKRRTDGQFHGAFGTTFLGQINRARYRCRMARHNLSDRIIIRRGAISSPCPASSATSTTASKSSPNSAAIAPTPQEPHVAWLDRAISTGAPHLQTPARRWP